MHFRQLGCVWRAKCAPHILFLFKQHEIRESYRYLSLSIIISGTERTTFQDRSIKNALVIFLYIVLEYHFVLSLLILDKNLNQSFYQFKLHVPYPASSGFSSVTSGLEKPLLAGYMFLHKNIFLKSSLNLGLNLTIYQAFWGTWSSPGLQINFITYFLE